MDRKIEKTIWKKYRSSMIGVIGTLLIILIYLMSSQREASLKINNQRINISTVEKGAFQEFITLNGSVVPLKTYFLDAIEGGRVESKFLDAGTYVEKGD